MNKIKYSVVVPTYNNLQQLSMFLDSFLGSCNLNETELILVDNGSDKDSGVADYLQQVVTQVDNTKLITNEKNEGFCVATNQGMAIADGKYIVWCNDDVLVPPGWLDRMANHLESPNPYHSNVGLVGPLTNYAKGAQSPNELKQAPPNELMSINLSLINQGDQDPMLVSFLSGFCLMMKREVFESIGGIDTLYSPGGYCDDDFVLRASKCGFGAVVSKDVFVYHFGSKTLDREFPELKLGNANWLKFHKKFQTSENKLLLVQLASFVDDEDADLYKKCAEKNSPLVDGVIILYYPGNGKVVQDKFFRDIWGDKLEEVILTKVKDPYDEVRFRAALLQRASAKSGYFDWVVSLDGFETLEGTREQLNKLMSPANPVIQSYSFLSNFMWNSLTQARVDGMFEEHYSYRMWANEDYPVMVRPYMYKGDTGLYCSHKPLSIPMDAGVVTNVTINNYALSSESRIAKHKNFLKKWDNLPNELRYQFTGRLTNEEILQTDQIMLTTPAPFDVSLVMMVKNEEDNIPQMVANHFAFVDEICAVDTGSTDKTVEILEAIGAKVVSEDLDDNFAARRNKSIEMATKKYCMHVDPDESPYPGYAQKIVKGLNRNPDIILVNFNNVQKNGNGAKTKQPRIFRRDPRFYYYGRVHETLDHCLQVLKDKGQPEPKAYDLDIWLMNRGFLRDDEALRNKLRFYARLLKKELQDHPYNVKAMLELAMHYRNIDRLDLAEGLLERALEIDPKYIQGIRELVLVQMAKAYGTVNKAEGLQSADQEMKQVIESLQRDLKKWCGGYINVGRGDGKTIDDEGFDLNIIRPV